MTAQHLVASLHPLFPPPAASVPGWATNNNTAATSCSACEAGRYSTEGNNAGAGACLACPAGQFQIAAGQTGCNDCPLNQFQAEPGQYLCQVRSYIKFSCYQTYIRANTTTQPTTNQRLACVN